MVGYSEWAIQRTDYALRVSRKYLKDRHFRRKPGAVQTAGGRTGDVTGDVTGEMTPSRTECTVHAMLQHCYGIAHSASLRPLPRLPPVPALRLIASGIVTWMPCCGGTADGAVVWFAT